MDTLVKIYGSIVVGMLLGLLVYACIDEPMPHPQNCYTLTIVASTVTGEIVSQKAEYDFIYGIEPLEKWLAEQGTTIERDTVNHLITIKVIQCVEPDIK
jgi:hypothetical protein